MRCIKSLSPVMLAGMLVACTISVVQGQRSQPAPVPRVATAAVQPLEEEPPLPVAFEEDFESGAERWELTDSDAWTLSEMDGSTVFGLNRRISDYQPKYRSPHNIALIKDLELRDFEITFDVRSTKDTGGHRDCCVFFCYQDPQNFYYVHLGAQPDPHSGQIMIVKEAPRKAITENETPVPWDSEWHQAKVVRDGQSGKIDIYFDDMEKPIMSAVDKTFGKGRIGIGSFDDMNDFDNIVIRGR